MLRDVESSPRVRLAAAGAAALLFLLPLSLTSGVVQTRSAQGTAAEQERLFQSPVAAAVERTHHTVRYDAAYIRIPYPGGDVPADAGVCTDEVIRAYRAMGIDL